MRLEAVIWDMDGLLLDTERLAIRTWQRAAREAGREIPHALFVECVGLNQEDTRALVLKRLGKEFPYEEVALRQAAIKQAIIKAEGLQVKPGARELLEYLKGKGMVMGLATSTSRKSALMKLESVNFASYFQALCFGDEVNNGKPHPEIFLKVAGQLHVEPKRSLVLEDSENGIRAAFAAGMLPVMIPDLKPPSREIKEKAFMILPSLLAVKELFQQDDL